MSAKPENELRAAWQAKAALLRARGQKNTLHDINQAADYLDAASAIIAQREIGGAEHVATAYYDGFVDGIMRQPWEAAADWAALQAQEYAQTGARPPFLPVCAADTTDDLVARLRLAANAFAREFPQYGGGLHAEAAERIALLPGSTPKPAPTTGVSGEGLERDLSGETVCGFKVAAYRETHPEHGDKYGHRYSEHWSTPSQNPAVKVERLFTEAQLRKALSNTSSEA